MRELRNVIGGDDSRARAVHRINTCRPVLTDEPPVPQQPQLALAPGTTVEEAERRWVHDLRTRDNKTRAAEILGISLKTLHNKSQQTQAEAERKLGVGLEAGAGAT